MPKVSIIVPVYKAESYLPRCIESILAQSISDFELLLVDDAGPDRSGIICDEYAKKDKRIRVIHKEKNEGASAARNTGLDAATGEYIMFCDSDDAVAQKWMEHLLELSGKRTLAICAASDHSAQLGQPKMLQLSSREPYPADQYFHFLKAGLAGFLWNSIYYFPTIQAHGLRFRTKHTEGDYNEDLIFNLEYLSHVDQVIYTGFADYLYEAHEGSLSRSYGKYYFRKYAEKYRLWKNFLLNNLGNDQLPQLADTYLYHFLVALKAQQGRYTRFRKIACSEELQDCLWLADCSKENPRIIQMLKKKAVFRLWIFYLLHSLKG